LTIYIRKERFCWET